MKIKVLFPICLIISVFSFSQDSTRFINYKWDLFRAVQGTIQISREQSISDKYSLNIGLLGTYATTRGLAKPYLDAQKFEYTEPTTNVVYSLSDVQAIGGGLNFQLRRYLGKNPSVGTGFYLTPEVFYRILNLESEVFNTNTSSNQTVKRTLNLGYIGYSLGYQKIYREMLSIDGYLGGGFFLSQYNDSNKLTEYRNSYQIDYTGFYLNMGVLIGIVR